MHHSTLLHSSTLLQYTQLALLLTLAQLIKHLHEEKSGAFLEQTLTSSNSTMYVTYWGVEPARRGKIHSNCILGLELFHWS
jgi:hypothetical protein